MAATLRALVLLVLLALSSSTASARLLRSIGQDGGRAARRTSDTEESPLPSGTEITMQPPLDPPAGEDGSPESSPPAQPEDGSEKPWLSPSADQPEDPAAPAEEQPASGDSTIGTDDSTPLPEQQPETETEPEQSPEQSPEQPLEQTPEQSLEQTPEQPPEQPVEQSPEQPLEQTPEQSPEQSPEQPPSDAEVAEAEQEHVDASDVGVPAADLTAAAGFPDAPADGEVAGTFDIPDAEDDAEFAAVAVAAPSGDEAGSVGSAPPADGTTYGCNGCHPKPPKNVHAYWADYDLYPPYSPKLKCPHGWRTAGDPDKQLVKGVLDDAFYRMVLPAINLDHSRRARALKCQPGDVVSLHHHHVAGCIEKGGTGRIIAQGDMEYVCWGSRKAMTVGQQVKGDFW